MSSSIEKGKAKRAAAAAARLVAAKPDAKGVDPYFTVAARRERERVARAEADAIEAADAAKRAKPPTTLVEKYRRLSPRMFDTRVWLLFEEKEKAAAERRSMTVEEWLACPVEDARVNEAFATNLHVETWIANLDADSIAAEEAKATPVKPAKNLRTDGDWEPEPFYAMPCAPVETQGDVENVEAQDDVENVEAVEAVAVADFWPLERTRDFILALGMTPSTSQTENIQILAAHAVIDPVDLRGVNPIDYGLCYLTDMSGIKLLGKTGYYGLLASMGDLCGPNYFPWK